MFFTDRPMPEFKDDPTFKSETIEIPENKLRNWVNNHVINSLGITKEWVESLIVPRLETIIERKLNDIFNSNWFTNLLQQSLFDMMKNGVKSGVYWTSDKRPLDSFVKECVNIEVKKMIREQFDIKIEVLLHKKGTVKNDKAGSI